MIFGNEKRRRGGDLHPLPFRYLMPIALPTMSFSFEEWSSTNHLFGNDDDTDKGAAAHFVGSNTNDDDDMLYDELEDDPEYFEGGAFLPRPKDWKDISFNEIPQVTFDMARSKFWKHGMKEIKYFIKKIKAIKDPSAKNKLDKVVNLLAGPNSELFHGSRQEIH